MAAKKRVPPRPIPLPKPPLKPSQRKSSTGGSNSGSGGFGKVEDQLIKAASAYINTVGGGIRGIVGVIGGALSGGGPVAGSFMGPAPSKSKPSTPPSGNWVGGKWIPPTKPSTGPISGGKIAKVEYELPESFKPRSGKRRPTVKPKLPKTM